MRLVQGRSRSITVSCLQVPLPSGARDRFFEKQFVALLANTHAFCRSDDVEERSGRAACDEGETRRVPERERTNQSPTTSSCHAPDAKEMQAMSRLRST